MSYGLAPFGKTPFGVPPSSGGGGNFTANLYGYQGSDFATVATSEIFSANVAGEQSADIGSISGAEVFSVNINGYQASDTAAVSMLESYSMSMAGFQAPDYANILSQPPSGATGLFYHPPMPLGQMRPLPQMMRFGPRR